MTEYVLFVNVDDETSEIIDSCIPSTLYNTRYIVSKNTMLKHDVLLSDDNVTGGLMFTEPKYLAPKFLSTQSLTIPTVYTVTPVSEVVTVQTTYGFKYITDKLAINHVYDDMSQIFKYLCNHPDVSKEFVLWWIMQPSYCTQVLDYIQQLLNSTTIDTHPRLFSHILLYAVQLNRLDIVRFVLPIGETPYRFDMSTLRSVIKLCARYGHIEVAEYILTRYGTYEGVSIYEISDIVMGLCIRACKYGHVSVLKLVLDTIIPMYNTSFSERLHPTRDRVLSSIVRVLTDFIDFMNNHIRVRDISHYSFTQHIHHRMKSSSMLQLALTHGHKDVVKYLMNTPHICSYVNWSTLPVCDTVSLYHVLDTLPCVNKRVLTPILMNYVNIGDLNTLCVLITDYGIPPASFQIYLDTLSGDDLDLINSRIMCVKYIYDVMVNRVSTNPACGVQTSNRVKCRHWTFNVLPDVFCTYNESLSQDWVVCLVNSHWSPTKKHLYHILETCCKYNQASRLMIFLNYYRDFYGVQSHDRRLCGMNQDVDLLSMVGTCIITACEHGSIDTLEYITNFYTIGTPNLVSDLVYTFMDGLLLAAKHGHVHVYEYCFNHIQQWSSNHDSLWRNKSKQVMILIEQSILTAMEHTQPSIIDWLVNHNVHVDIGCNLLPRLAVKSVIDKGDYTMFNCLNRNGLTVLNLLLEDDDVSDTSPASVLEEKLDCHSQPETTSEGVEPITIHDSDRWIVINNCY